VIVVDLDSASLARLRFAPSPAYELLGWLLDGRDADEARAALLETMRAHEGPDGVTFGSAAWLVTAIRGG